MKKVNLNMGFNESNGVDQFPGIELSYTVSKEQVYENLLFQLDHPRHKSWGISRNLFTRLAVAATVVLLLGLSVFIRFYTTTIYTAPGQQLSYYLPDGSTIELNALSEINFHPYWFRVSRTLTLNGEAFFKVQKGTRFKVVSKLGETTVLGTSFNIYSRNSDYCVTCFTGKVRVVSAGKNEKVLLNPNEKAYLNQEGFFRFVQKANMQEIKSWRENMFVFTGASIVYVLQEIERQYNIKINFQGDPALTYTGNFSRSLSGKEVLNLVCTTLGIKFDAKSDTEYLVN